MAAMHHDFNILNIPSAHDTIIMRCNEKDALHSVEHVYREAATMFPADEDLLEHSGDLARKKQLVSQERAAAKKATVKPLLLGLSGKKPSASPSAEPSEDLVHPMLDMSIGEAATSSGRRPQFTQEHSTTKKIPLKAGGCKVIRFYPAMPMLEDFQFMESMWDLANSMAIRQGLGCTRVYPGSPPGG
jgi:hypothetical protein